MAESISQGAELLAEAIGEPFAPTDGDDTLVEFDSGESLDLTPGALTSPIVRWYRLAQREAPLWCFDKYAFRRLQPERIPSSHPLRLMNRRIEADEVIEGQEPSGLRTNVYVRRVGLADPDGAISGVRSSRLDGEWRYATSNRRRFDEIGLFEMDFLERKMPKRSRGAMAKVLPTPTLEALFQEGGWLFDLIWEVWMTSTAQEIIPVLEALGIPPETHQEWSVRLALPMLSAAELGATWDSADEWVTARKMTIFSLSHRLGLEPRHVFRRLIGSGAEQRYDDWQSATGITNPINLYLPTTP